MDETGTEKDRRRGEQKRSSLFASSLAFSGWWYTRRQHEWCTTLCFSHNFIQPDHGPHGNPWQMYPSANFKLVARKRKRGLSEAEGASVKLGEREKSRYWINQAPLPLAPSPAAFKRLVLRKMWKLLAKGGNIYWKLWLGGRSAWRSKRIYATGKYTLYTGYKSSATSSLVKVSTNFTDRVYRQFRSSCFLFVMFEFY